MNTNEFYYFFVVDFLTFFSTELETLSENEPDVMTLGIIAKVCLQNVIFAQTLS